MTKNKIVKIIVPVLMVVCVVGIWLFESSQEAPAETSEYPLNVQSVSLEELEKEEMPVIIDFGADECVPCKNMAPVLVELNEEMQGKAIIQFVDVWKNPEAAKEFPVQVIPTQIMINSDGSPYMPSDEVVSQIEFLQYVDVETEEHIFTAHQGELTKEQMLLILSDMGVS